MKRPTVIALIWLAVMPWWMETLAWAALPGDDNHDGVVMEDETGWDCRFMGNRVCGQPWEDE